MFLETSRGKYVGFILALGVTDLLRSLEAVRGHQRSKFKERPIFWSLATNLGTTFKAPKNLGALAPYFFLQNAIHLTICGPGGLVADQAGTRVAVDGPGGRTADRAGARRTGRAHARTNTNIQNRV